MASSGFTQLWGSNWLDLTVERLILKPEFRGLFSDDEVSRARNRLAHCGLGKLRRGR